MSLALSLAPPAPEIRERHLLGMPEMGFRGVSEQWLMRRAGDLHWRLIARAMGQREAVFTCAEGQPLYAAFCATSLRITAPRLPELGGFLTISASLGRLGHGRLASVQRLLLEGKTIGRIVLISTFVGRSDPFSNRSILRRTPRALALPPEAPALARRIANQAVRLAKVGGKEFPGPSISLMPCPYTDFNAAKLMYFPSFIALAERADFSLGGECERMIGARDVIYLGNVEPGKAVRATLARRLRARTDCLLNTSDGRQLALLRSRYHCS